MCAFHVLGWREYSHIFRRCWDARHALQPSQSSEVRILLGEQAPERLFLIALQALSLARQTSQILACLWVYIWGAGQSSLYTHL